MAKNLRDIIGEVAEPRAGDEKRFKDKHVVQDNPYPVRGTDDVLNARKAKKDTTKLTHSSKEEEEDMYEHAMGVVNEIYNELLTEDRYIIEGILEDIHTIAESEEPSFITLQDGSEIEVDPETAEAISNVVEFLNDENRDKFLARLEESEESFMRMVDFAVSMSY